ncbi:hypothetical protein DPMN_075683, partial [Dreissena polymorpha]
VAVVIDRFQNCFRVQCHSEFLLVLPRLNIDLNSSYIDTYANNITCFTGDQLLTSCSRD